jgi:hypothetical protein
MKGKTTEGIAGLRIYSQNVYRKYDHMSMLLEFRQDKSDVILIQEPAWVTVRHAPSMLRKDGDPVTGVPIHPMWMCIVPKKVVPSLERPRVVAYVHKRLASLKPKNRTDVINDPDVLLITLKGPAGPLNLINVYNDKSTNSAINLLSAVAADLPEIGYMGGDFNCPSPLWDDTITNHNSSANRLYDLADLMRLEVQRDAIGSPTHFPFNGGRPSIIDLAFLPEGDTKSSFSVGERGPSDHAPLLTEIPFTLDFEYSTLRIKPGSEEESEFLKLVSQHLTALEVPPGPEGVSDLVTRIAKIVESAWLQKATVPKVSRHSKAWWNADCTHAKRIAERVNTKDNWIALHKATKKAKRDFFDNRITEIADKAKRPWDLMNWVKPRKLPPMEELTFEGLRCNTEGEAWNALHSTFNSARDRLYDTTCFDNSVPQRNERKWWTFSEAELMEALAPCSGRSAPGPDHLTWTHLRCLTTDKTISSMLLWIADACINVGIWPDEFKESITVVIPKPGKPAYDVPKAFRPIVLLNTMGKLIEKMIANRLQFDAAKNGILHPCQFGGVRQNSTEDAGVYLTHLVRAGWAKGMKTSVVAFDLAQYFPSLNHDVIIHLLDRFGFATQVVNFFKSYLVGRSTRYSWDLGLSPKFKADVGVGQGSALSPILSALYLAPLLWQFQLDAPEASLMSYVDDGTIIVQSHSWTENLANLKSAYSVVFKLMEALGLVLEHDKSEAFHFSRKDRDDDPPVDLGYAPYTGQTPLQPKTVWRYLGFFFDRKLSFKEHTQRYSTKAFTTVKAMASLGNSV